MKKNVLIVNYNTTALTSAAIRSLWKHTPGCHVTVFDNSDRKPFAPTAELHGSLEVIDNTRGQIIDFDRWLDGFPDKAPSPENNYASAKHCKSVDCCFDLLPEGFMLMDSDVLVKKDITPLFDRRYAWVGRMRNHKSAYGIRVPRVQPFLCWINVPMLRQHGVRYCNDEKMWSLSQRVPDKAYDTGCWFYEDCMSRMLPVREEDIGLYIIHLGHASWRDKDTKQWLADHRELWE